MSRFLSSAKLYLVKQTTFWMTTLLFTDIFNIQTAMKGLSGRLISKNGFMTKMRNYAVQRERNGKRRLQSKPRRKLMSWYGKAIVVKRVVTVLADGVGGRKVEQPETG